MASDYTHLSEAAIAALELPIDERCAWIVKDRFIIHEQIHVIFAYTDMLVNGPPRSRAMGLIVAGVGGSGKTMLAAAVLRRYPEVQGSEGKRARIPVVRISMSGAREGNQIFTRLLVALGCPHIDRYTRLEREVKVLELISQAGLSLLIIDEIQDIVNGTKIQQKNAFEGIKWLMNESGIAILALGTEDAEDAMSRDPHLKSRFPDPIQLSSWKAGRLLANFLDELETCLPLRERSRLSSIGTMRYLVKVSGGSLHGIVRRVTAAAALAVESGEERISQTMLERAETEIPSFYSRMRRASRVD